ncbi:MAG: hypothetical protein MJE77_20405 [Proteobacteria bacterium]|nr:hypothetical protein [Pseudomonadota bacterium]
MLVTAVASTWQPFQIRGEWRDTWAGPGFAKATFRELQRLVSRVPLVRLEIDDPEVDVPAGVIRRFERPDGGRTTEVPVQ